MGCATSLVRGRSVENSTDAATGGNALVKMVKQARGGDSRIDVGSNDPELAAYLQPVPDLPIRIGHGARKPIKARQCIIFIFGGPGSMKGLMVDEIVSDFGFEVLTTEDIVLNYLPNKVANTVETTPEIQDLLRSDKTVLTLEWVLHMISARLSTSTCKRFLIDIVPNLNSILKGESFSSRDFAKELSAFERRHQVLFALEFSVPKDRIVQSTSGIMMRVERRRDQEQQNEAASGKKKKKKKPKKGDEAEDPSKSIFASTSDEADSARLKKRNEYYLACAQPFLNYFDKDQRVVSIEVMTHVKVHLQKRVKELLSDMSFRPIFTNGIVILFVGREVQIEGLDLDYYRMTKTVLSDVVPATESDLPLSVTFRALRRHVNTLMTTNHVIVLDWLDLTSKLGDTIIPVPQTKVSLSTSPSTGSRSTSRVTSLNSTASSLDVAAPSRSKSVVVELPFPPNTVVAPRPNSVVGAHFSPQSSNPSRPGSSAAQSVVSRPESAIGENARWAQPRQPSQITCETVLSGGATSVTDINRSYAQLLVVPGVGRTSRLRVRSSIVPDETGNSEKKRYINFVEVRECYLDHFIKLRSTELGAAPYKKPFKVVATTDDAVVLFPAEMSTAMCRTISHLFGCSEDSLSFDGDSATNNALFEELMARKSLPSTLTDNTGGGSNHSGDGGGNTSSRLSNSGMVVTTSGGVGGDGDRLLAPSPSMVAQKESLDVVSAFGPRGASFGGRSTSSTSTTSPYQTASTNVSAMGSTITTS